MNRLFRSSFIVLGVMVAALGIIQLSIPVQADHTPAHCAADCTACLTKVQGLCAAGLCVGPICTAVTSTTGLWNSACTTCCINPTAPACANLQALLGLGTSTCIAFTCP